MYHCYNIRDERKETCVFDNTCHCLLQGTREILSSLKYEQYSFSPLLMLISIAMWRYDLFSNITAASATPLQE